MPARRRDVRGFRPSPASPDEERTGPRLTALAARDWRRRWDQQQTAMIPDREERFEVMIEALEVVSGPQLRILDLGCGTGSLAERLLRRYPRARAVAVDYDPVLLEIGRTGLGDLGGRLAWVDADLRKPDWTRKLPIRRFDVVASTTALHWMTPRELSRLYSDLAHLLRPGGWFFNGDFVRSPDGSSRFHRFSRAVRRRRERLIPIRGATWNEFWRSVLRDPRLAPEARLHRMRFPHPHARTRTADLNGHIRRLRGAGFREVNLIWTRWENRVIAAMR